MINLSRLIFLLGGINFIIASEGDKPMDFVFAALGGAFVAAFILTLEKS